jgi:hypothetical protein
LLPALVNARHCGEPARSFADSLEIAGADTERDGRFINRQQRHDIWLREHRAISGTTLSLSMASLATIGSDIWAPVRWRSPGLAFRLRSKTIGNERLNSALRLLVRRRLNLDVLSTHRGIAGDKSSVVHYTSVPRCRGDNVPKFGLQRERPAPSRRRRSNRPGNSQADEPRNDMDSGKRRASPEGDAARPPTG